VIVEMVWKSGVLSGTGWEFMGSIEVTTLHPRWSGDPKLPPGTGCGTVLIRELLKRGAPRRRPVVDYSYEHEPVSCPYGEKLRWPK
jgi:hypothetical protein